MKRLPQWRSGGLAVALLLASVLPAYAANGAAATTTPLLTEYTFDQDLQGWTQDAGYMAEFGDPAVSFSKDLGDGALKINAVVTDDTQGWQELRVKKTDIENLAQMTQLTFDLYFDLSAPGLDAYPKAAIKPYLVFDPGWIKVGEGANSTTVGGLQKVTLGGKSYGKLQARIVMLPDQVKNAQTAYIGVVTSNLKYTGPIYLDNVKFSQGDTTTPTEPGVQPDNHQGYVSTAGFSTKPVNLVDPKATDKTRSLFAYLNGIRGKAILFGHQHETTEGITVTKQDGTQSDVKNDVGAYSAVYGWDTLSLEGKEKPGAVGNTDTQNRDALVKVMKQAYDRGGILALSSHMPNFATGGGFYDTGGNVVSHILPGGDKNAEFNRFLDKIADFAHHMKDGKGNPIPVIFRPFHENNGSWFWWGAAFTSRDQYIELYRYTVEYLRDRRDVHNFLYVFSPNGPFNGDSAKYLDTYPGDEFIDILGFDQYDSTEGSPAFFDKVVQDAAMISKLADAKGKVATFSEFGYSTTGMKVTGNKDLNWFTDLLKALKSDPDAKRMAYMQTWATFGMDQIFLPYRNAPGYGNHELLDDFIRYYNDPYTAFGDNVKGQYDLKVKTLPEKPLLHIVTPTDEEAVKTPVVTVRASLRNQNVSKVVFSEGSSPKEYEMKLNRENGMWWGNWTPTADRNRTAVILKVKAYLGQKVVLQDTATFQLTAAGVLAQAYTFDKNIDGVQSNGAWPDTIRTAVSHGSVGKNGMIRIDADIPDNAQTWEELKLQLNGVSLQYANEAKFDVLLPANALTGNENALIMGVAMVPPNWNDKYGMDQWVKLTDLPKVTLGGKSFIRYAADIDLSASKERSAATQLALSIVLNGAKYAGPIYVDNVKLLNSYHEPVADPTVVDDFEGYNGNDSLLGAKYTVASSGDTVKVSLSADLKSGGKYGLKFDYALGGSGYGGVTKNLDNVDWSAAGKLKFWLTPDGKNQKLVIQVKANGASFEAYPSLADTTPRWVEIPFSEFAPAPWDTSHAGAKLDAVNAKTVQQFSIYVNAKEAGTTLSGSLYFDDIHVE